MFSPSTVEILRNAGWTPTRRVNALPWIDISAREGFNPHFLASELLSNLRGLVIQPPRAERIYFDPIIASGEFDRVREWQNLCKANLFLLGEVLSNFILLIDEFEKVCVGFDDGLFHMGDTFDVGFQRLY